MPGRIRSSILIFIAAAACTPPDAATPMVDTAADAAAVNAVREAEAAALSSGDVSSAYLSEDAVLMPPDAPAVVGIDAIRTWATEFMAQVSSVSVNYTDTNVTVSGDWAIETYAGTMTLTPAGGGDAMTQSVKGIHVYRREADGSWKMVYDVWNTDAPPPSPM